MKHPILFSLLLLLSGLTAVLLNVLPLALAQEPGEAVLYQENFDHVQGWDLEPGWQVIRDGDNPVLAGEGHHWARPDVQFGGDFRVRFRLKLMRGDIHLVYRLNNIGRYFIGFHQGGTSLSKQY